MSELRVALSAVALGVFLVAGAGTAGCSSDPKQNAKLAGAAGVDQHGTLSPGDGGDGNEVECERVVSFQPVILGESQPFDLVIVADNSQSLSWSRDALASGLQDLLMHVRGRSVRVFLLTPTQYGASSALSQLPKVAWQDPETGKPYSPAATSYSQQCTDPTGASIPCPTADASAYRLDGHWDFLSPEPIAVITPTLTDAEFAAQQAAVAKKILDLVGSGSPSEQPLCTLGRYISQDHTKLPQNATFLLITDEDDVSEPKDCLVRYTKEVTSHSDVSSTVACEANCDQYRFSMQVRSQTLQTAITCVAVTDTGDAIPGTEKSVSGPFNAGCDGGQGPGACSSFEEDDAKQRCGAGYRVSSCARKCVEDTRACEFTTDQPVSDCSICVSKGTQSLGPCTAQGGVKFEYDVSYSATFQNVPLTSGSTTDALASYFRSQADSALGSTHYLVQGIVLDSAFSCPLGPGQSYAQNLARMIGARSHLFPLCESYAPALGGVLDFAKTLIQTDFTLSSLEDDEDVTAVTVIDASGAPRQLPDSQYQFDLQTRVLHIEPSAILDSDTDLRVEVTSACRPVVR